MSSTSIWLLSYASLSSYCLAGCLMEHFAVFSGWLFVGTNELTAVQSTQGNGSLVIYVVPKVLLTVFTIILVLNAPITTAPMDITLLRFSLAMLAVSWGSSFVVQIPLQLRIRKYGDRMAIRRLIRTDWVRVLTMIAHCCAVVYMIAGTVRT